MGPIAQSVEQRTFNPWVDGSSPSGPTLLKSYSLDTKTIVEELADSLQHHFP